ncbi:hypothetical protein M3649_19320 [Ureibacillus chungkukjangi]|uniref:hypothetical protein n=1 Tax=Ureibacillus chungkukjangi TaxID=1202712 RepID=UPI00203EF0A6|nr:hypothetical protein [Ureibacillus chungkukjangi]MCM3390252.1 hypothetical protein [Ureibacillus chungkukjangi]
MKEINEENKIIIIHAKNVFIEVKNAFEIGQIQITLSKYDPSQEKFKKIEKSIDIYMSFDKFLLFSNDVLSGRISALAKLEREKQKKEGNEYCVAIYVIKGGTPEEKLKGTGKERKDGKSVSRQFKITPGKNSPWVLSGESGPGEIKNGLIIPCYVKGKPEVIVRVPLTDEELKRLVLIVNAHVQAYINSQYQVKYT